MGRKVSTYRLTPQELTSQINKVSILLDENLLNFMTATTKKAYNTFQKSFKYKRFYSANGGKWQQLSDFTIKKRTHKGTWPGRGILEDNGILKKSIRVDTSGSKLGNHKFRGRVFTNPKFFEDSKNPNRPLCYAGLHNNPSSTDTYGNGFGGKQPKRIVQRQFMGFSTYIDKFMNDNIDKYLFDNVFGGSTLYQVNVAQNI